MKKYEVYRLSYYQIDENYQNIFFKKNIEDIIDYIKDKPQTHLFKIDGIDSDANFIEIDISDKFEKRYFYVDENLNFRFKDNNELLDIAKYSFLLVNIALAYKDNNYKKYDAPLTKDLEKFFNTDDLHEYGLNPYITIFKEEEKNGR